MNTKGQRSNLVASHPENRNAEKSGVFSPRRRAEEKAKVTARLAQDPAGYLRAELEELYADSRGFHELLTCDVAENGVSDRHGNPRRQVGTLQKQTKLCLELLERLRAISGAGDSDASYRQEPWSEGEGLDLLRSFAHDPTVSDSTRFSSTRLLLERKGHTVARWIDSDLDEDRAIELDRQIFEMEVREALSRDPSPRDRRLYELLCILQRAGVLEEGQFEELLVALAERPEAPDVDVGKTEAADAVPAEQ